MIVICTECHSEYCMTLIEWQCRVDYPEGALISSLDQRIGQILRRFSVSLIGRPIMVLQGVFSISWFLLAIDTVKMTGD